LSRGLGEGICCPLSADSRVAPRESAVADRRRETCEVDEEEELPAILDLFVDPQFAVNNMKVLFTPEETDVDTLLEEAIISVSTRRLVKQAWREGRPSS